MKKNAKKNAAKKATTTTGKANGTEKKTLREGSFVARLVALIQGKPLEAEAIVKALKAEKHLGKRTPAAYVSGFRRGLKRAGFALASGDKGWTISKQG
jgi:hypothetical protein